MTIKLLIPLILFSAALNVVTVGAKRNPPNMAKPGCNGTCGEVTIPYPFGIGANCSHDQWFEIECKTSSTDHSTSKPFLSKFQLEVLEVNNVSAGDYYPGPYVIVRIPPLHVCDADKQSQQPRSSINLTGSPYSFSTRDNVFIMEGCQGSAILINQSGTVMAGCGTVCQSNNSAIPIKSCYGVQCCQAPLPSDYRQTLLQFYQKDFNRQPPLQFYQIDFNRQPSPEGQNCLWGSLIKWDSVGNLSSDPSSAVPVFLFWNWTGEHWPDHSHHASCTHEYGGVECACDSYYYGNPYISGGCQAPEGCEGCQGYCKQTLDPSGNAIPNKYYCEKKPLLNLAAILGLSSSFGMLLLVACFYGLYRLIKWIRVMKRRAKFFKCNGGLLLQQQLSSKEGVVERTKIFTVSELDKATDHFNENRILGQGGQGTVYKGMLTDGSIVAVKKSKLLDEAQLEQFINEVVVLSRINHRHVVKLFGCCLETEVPLLVYEFIPNGTLFQHIHDPEEDFSISWQMRLKIAADSAGAVAYLHSSSSIPIYHRDIKSSNILLDEKHRGKVSDFGSSKTIAIDQTHLTTLVQGTMGYLDPEYFQTYQFTEKSDVYSFGVVILELLTSKKPIYRDASTMEQKNLVTEFLFLSENSRLSHILDPKIVGEAKEDELISVVELAKRCISWSGRLRPTMKEVAMTLEMIMKSPSQVSAWYQQQEAIPNQYAAYDEFDMTDISREEFTSVTLPTGACSPPYTDENPLLPPSDV